MALHDHVGSSIEQLIARHTEGAVKEATKGGRPKRLVCLFIIICYRIQGVHQKSRRTC